MYLEFAFTVATYEFVLFTTIIVILQIIKNNKPWWNWLIVLLWIIMWIPYCINQTKEFLKAKKECNEN